MNHTYYTMATNKEAQEGFTQMIEETLSTISSDQSVLFHCFAGKDRTGISAALLLEILNMPRKVIYTDYMATNALRVKENNELVQLAQSNGLNAKSIPAFRVTLNVEADYLDTFYQTVEDEFGTIHNFISTQLKISPTMQSDLRHLLLNE